MYALNWNQPGRRTGLTRDGYKAPSLLQSINSSNSRNTMRQKTSPSVPEEKMNPAKEDLSDEDIEALPKDESDTSDEGNTSHAADIKPTLFIRRGSEDPNASSQKANGTARERKSEAPSILGKGKSTRSAKNTRPSRQLSPGSSSKRKNGENDVELGSGMADQFGQIKVKKAKAGKTYGSASQKSNTRRAQLTHPKGM